MESSLRSLQAALHTTDGESGMEEVTQAMPEKEQSSAVRWLPNVVSGRTPLPQKSDSVVIIHGGLFEPRWQSSFDP